jgi:hypothetical protein
VHEGSGRLTAIDDLEIIRCQKAVYPWGLAFQCDLTGSYRDTVVVGEEPFGFSLDGVTNPLVDTREVEKSSNILLQKSGTMLKVEIRETLTRDLSQEDSTSCFEEFLMIGIFK